MCDLHIILPAERNEVSRKTKSKCVISIIMPVERNEVSLKIKSKSVITIFRRRDVVRLQSLKV